MCIHRFLVYLSVYLLLNIQSSFCMDVNISSMCVGGPHTQSFEESLLLRQEEPDVCVSALNKTEACILWDKIHTDTLEQLSLIRTHHNHTTSEIEDIK